MMPWQWQAVVPGKKSVVAWLGLMGICRGMSNCIACGGIVTPQSLSIPIVGHLHRPHRLLV